MYCNHLQTSLRSGLRSITAIPTSSSVMPTTGCRGPLWPCLFRGHVWTCRQEVLCHLFRQGATCLELEVASILLTKYNHRLWKHVANSCKLWMYLAYPYPSPFIPTPSLEIYFSIFLKFPRSMSSNSLMLFHVGMLGVDPLLFLLNILRYDCLKDDGIFLLHTLGWAKRGEWNHNAFATLAWSMGVQESTRSHIKPPTTPWMKWVRS